MSASTYTDIWCDVCGKWDDAATSKTATEARRISRMHGWRVSLPGGLDVCPSCVAKGYAPTVPLGNPAWVERTQE